MEVAAAPYDRQPSSSAVKRCLFTWLDSRWPCCCRAASVAGSIVRPVVSQKGQKDDTQQKRVVRQVGDAKSVLLKCAASKQNSKLMPEAVQAFPPMGIAHHSLTTSATGLLTDVQAY